MHQPVHRTDTEAYMEFVLTCAAQAYFGSPSDIRDDLGPFYLAWAELADKRVGKDKA